MPMSFAWTSNGTIICDETQHEYDPDICPDNKGGAIIAWGDGRSGSDIYAQRIDSKGKILWTSNGAPVCTAEDEQSNPKICSDGAGGAIIVFGDITTGDIDLYAQRINAQGTKLWDARGIPICTAVNDQTQYKIIPDGVGGAYIAWMDRRTGFDVYVQRIDSAGHPKWNANGTVVCNATKDQTDPVLCLDGANGVIIAWTDTRMGFGDIYAQRYNSAGQAQWTLNGTAICNEGGGQTTPKICSDGQGGAILAWCDFRTLGAIYMQRINNQGTSLWASNGISVYTMSGSLEDLQIVPDGNGGAIIACIDDNSIFTLVTQRLDSTGTKLWTTGGVSVFESTSIISNLVIADDGTGGVVLVWTDDRIDLEPDLYAQRVDSSGTPVWATNGMIICNDPATQNDPRVTRSGTNIIIGWVDGRNDNWDVYAYGLTLAKNYFIIILIAIIVPLILLGLALFVRYKKQDQFS